MTKKTQSHRTNSSVYELNKELLEAALCGDTEKIQTTLSQGARVNVGDSSGPDAPLKFAVREGQEEAITLLINKGAKSQEYYKEQGILDDLHHFLKTKEIKDSLLVFFDQFGNFHDIHFPWSGRNEETDEIIRKSAKGLYKIKIPISKLVSHNPNNQEAPSLKSSYVHQGFETLKLDYKKISGRLVAEDNVSIKAPHLESIGLELLTSYSSSYEGGELNFPKLKEIGSHLVCPDCRILEFPELKEVGGKLIIKQGIKTMFDALEKVGGTLYFAQDSPLTLPKLKEVGGDFKAPSSKKVLSPNLRKIGGELVLSDIRSSSFGSLFEVGEKITLGRTTPQSLEKLLEHLNTQCLQRISQSEDNENKTLDPDATKASQRLTRMAKTLLNKKQTLEKVKGQGLDLI